MEVQTATGEVVQIVGPVIDAQFPADSVPDIMHALEIIREDGSRLVLEVQQHLGENRVRTIAMDSTEGLPRGTRVVNTGRPIAMPYGPEIRGRLFNVIGEAIDGLPQPAEEGRRPIHAKAPAFEDLATTTEMLETGIKVVDLLEPYARGGKIGLFGGAGVGASRWELAGVYVTPSTYRRHGDRPACGFRGSDGAPPRGEVPQRMRGAWRGKGPRAHS